MPLFVAKNGQTYGPHELEEIAVFLGTGDFVPEDHCWQEGWNEWRTLASVLPDRPLRSSPTAVAGAPAMMTPPAPQTTGQIPADIAVHGTLKLPGERTVTCYVEGEIHCPSTVTIAKDTKVKAHIRAESVVIFGEVDGEVHATGRAVIKSSGSLRGDIHAARVLIEEGAAFSGKSHVNSRAAAPDAGKTKPPPAAKKSAPAKSAPKAA
ncbi:MAG: polymer-forming cytoskeletal protein [Chthoniobacterales bacterium]